MKLKEKLIHILGGYTAAQMYDNYMKGKQDAVQSIKREMDEIHGTPADEWCGHMYTSVCMRRKT